MLNMVNDLLNITSIESGKIELRRQKQDLGELYQNVIGLINNLAEQKQISIVFQNDLKQSMTDIDSGKIEQVLINLMTNAVKFSHKETSIKVYLSKKNNMFLTQVKDQGVGIPNDEMKLLFRPFQKTSAQTTDGEASTGLGLFIVKNIIQAHGGEIWAESKQGEGTSFYYTLPVREDFKQ